MNARTLCFMILSIMFGSSDCWGQPLRNPDTGTLWIYGPNGRTMMGDHLLPKSPTYSPNRSTPNRRNDQRQSSKPISNDEYFAPNLKIYFQLVRVGGAAGARLTQTPSRDSGVSNIKVNGSPVYLEPDDVIYQLDGLPIRRAVDVMNHHGKTAVLFVDHRTGRAFSGVMDLASYTPLPYDVPQELFAENLGTHYQLIALGSGVFGARLSRTAAANTPAGALQLERGDMIIRLDGQPIHGPKDMLGHFAGTSIEFVNIRTGNSQMAYVQLPDSLPSGSAEAR